MLKISHFTRLLDVIGALAALALPVASAGCGRESPHPSKSTVGTVQAIEPRGNWNTDYRGDIAVTLVTAGVKNCGSFRYKKLPSAPETYFVSCNHSHATYRVVPSISEISLLVAGTADPEPLPQGGSEVVNNANSEDLHQAQEFLAQLPPACGRTGMNVRSDGTVVIHIRCAGNGKAVDGIMTIKDGIVTNVQ